MSHRLPSGSRAGGGDLGDGKGERWGGAGGRSGGCVIAQPSTSPCGQAAMFLQRPLVVPDHC